MNPQRLEMFNVSENLDLWLNADAGQFYTCAMSVRLEGEVRRCGSVPFWGLTSRNEPSQKIIPCIEIQIVFREITPYIMLAKRAYCTS